MTFVKGGVCAPKGFLAAGAYSGIKKNPLNKDLALIFSKDPAVAAGVFTTNKIKAACVDISKEHLKNNKAQAIIANSGNANCCTGIQGKRDTKDTAEAVALELRIKEADILVASTGVIGRLLPMAKIIDHLPGLVKNLSVKNSPDAAAAIMTTDKIRKELAVRFKIGDAVVSIGAIAKGSGMICPNMATMLAFITTDAAIAPGALKAALKNCVDKSFNCISVDGDTSTNDMALILANAAGANKEITLKTKKAFEKFNSALLEITIRLAKLIAKDGEGATKLIEVYVKGAKTPKDAKLAASTVCNSNLVKTAIYGQDANWGRILAALGRSGAALSQNRLSVSLGSTNIFTNGKPAGADEAILKCILSKEEVRIAIDLGIGKHAATMWTCDLSEEYIRINAKYRT